MRFPFLWSILCVYEENKAFEDQCECLVDHPYYDWNAPITYEGESQDETPLYWYAAAATNGVKSVLKTLPKMALRTDVNWLITAKGIPFKTGTCPLTFLLQAANEYPETKISLHQVLDRLFETTPNFPTFLDDLIHHKNFGDEPDMLAAQQLIRENRARWFERNPTPVNPIPNKPLARFYVRLQKARKNDCSTRLLQQITQATRDAQLDFLNPVNSTNNSPFGLPKAEIHRRLNKLKPNECYRIPKRIWGLDRTMTVLRTPKGEYQLMLETKSKLPTHSVENPQKTDIYNRNGAFKEGQPTWRIDREEIKYFHLVQKSNSNKARAELENEVVLSQKLGKTTKHILTYQLGLLRHRGEKQQRSIYSLGGKGTVIEMHEAFKARDKLGKYEMIHGLLQACQVFHDNGYCHRDLSSSNVILMNHKNEAYLAAADFGNARKTGSPENSRRTTYDYESPEISAWISKTVPRDHEHYKYYHVRDTQDSLARAIFKKLPDNIDLTHIQKVDPADDMWALGINVFRILHDNAKPTLQDFDKINADPLLKGLLAIKRSERINIGQALKICNETIIALKALQKPKPAVTIQYDAHQATSGASTQNSLIIDSMLRDFNKFSGGIKRD